MTDDNTPKISARAQAIKPSATLAVSGRAGELRAAGKEVLNFAAGEPDFKPPTAVRKAASDMSLNSAIRYAPVPGVPALRDAVAKELGEFHGRSFARGQVLVSCGAKHSLANLFLTLLDPGDEVIVCAPYWVSYPDMVLLAGGEPVIVAAGIENAFRITPDQLEAAITPKTKWFLFNSPSNPSGAGYSREELKPLTDVLMRHPHVWVMTDDMYEHLAYDDFEFCTPAQVEPALYDRTLTVNGVSKAYAMTGWRIGYGAGPAPLIAAMVTVQSQICSGACSVAQAAATAALTGPQDNIEAFRTAFERRRNLVVEAVANIPGLSLDAPGGAFYALIGCAPLIDGVRFKDDTAFVAYLLSEARIASVPGSVYGTPGFFRISTATNEDTLSEAMRRIGVAVRA